MKQFPGGCPAPLREGITFNALGGDCPIQAYGFIVGKDTEFAFRARHGTWRLEIDGPTLSVLVGVDRWDGGMPPSVAFALITSHLLCHVCGGVDPFYLPARGMGCTPPLERGEPGSRTRK